MMSAEINFILKHQGEIMRFLVLEVILIIVEILLFEIIQGFINIIHKPYIKFKNENNAVVYIYQLSRTGGNSYTEYSFSKKNGKWKYIINKDYIHNFEMYMIILFCGMLIAFFVKGMPPLINAIQIFVALIFAIALVFVYFPLKSYCLLKKS